MKTEPAAASPPRRRRRLLPWCVGALLLGVLALEGTLRLFVYTDVAWGQRWRQPWMYADRWNDPFYFQLNQFLTHDPAPLPPLLADARLGWIHDGMDRQHFSDPHEVQLEGRRPVLLFGASFVRCMTNEENCFEGWMERSAQGREFAVLNYGVRGYGIDQTAMLVRLAIPHWRDRNALIAVGIFVEDDLDRTILDFRGWPKPRFELDAKGQLIEPGVVPTPEQYEALHPMWAHSLAWGWLVHQSHLIPTPIQRWLAGTSSKTTEKRRLADAILDRLERDLQEAGIEHFYVLFPSVRDCELLEGASWQEKFLLQWFDGRKLPFVNVRRDLLGAALEQDRHPTAFFGMRNTFPEHLTPDGNEVAFQSLLRGIRGEFDHAAGRRPPNPIELHNLDPQDPKAGRFEFGWTRKFPDEADRERIVMQPTGNVPVRYGCIFSRPARRFVATAKLRASHSDSGDSPLKLEIKANGKSVFEAVLDAEHSSAAISLDMVGTTTLEIIASRPDATHGTDSYVLLARPHFE
jgi:hypothetical protein